MEEFQCALGFGIIVVLLIVQISKGTHNASLFLSYGTFRRDYIGEYFDVEVFKNSGRKPSEGFL